MNVVGISKEELDTPSLLVDLDVMESNMKRMSDFLRGKKARLRPHTKVHRTPIIAQKQVEFGAIGICCQKVRQAEVMTEGGIKDIFITNVVATPQKITRLANLAKYSNMTVLVDDATNAEELSRCAQKAGSMINVVIDVHVGGGRFGVESRDEALRLAEKVRAMRGLSFIGLMAHIGFLSLLEPRNERRSKAAEAEALLVRTKQFLEEHGVKVERLSSGTTGTYDVSASNPEISEIRPGSYVLMDGHYKEHVPEFDCAITVLGTVISKHPEGTVVVDVGMASMSTEYGNPRVVGSDDLEVFQVHAENTLIKPKKPTDIRVGDKIELIPSYVDGTVVRNDRILGIRNGELEIVWEIIGRNASY